MIFDNPTTDYIVILTGFLTISFALGILFGFKSSGFGDAIAVLLVGLGSIILQAYLLPGEINVQSWIIYSVVGTLIGVAVNFVSILILLNLEYMKLDTSHVFTFPLSLAGLIIGQYFYLSTNSESSTAMSWAIFSVVGFGVAFIVIAVLAIPIDFEFDILITREESYSAMVKWALLGLVLGICYSITTSQVLQQWYG